MELFGINLLDVWSIVAQVVAVSAAIAALTPTPKDDKIIGQVQGWIKKLSNLGGLNFFNAKNKD